MLFILNVYSESYTLDETWVECNNGVKILDPYYSAGVSFSWIGESKNGKANGYGTAIRYVNGQFDSKYEGSYIDGVREGKGTITGADGSVRTGTFINGQLTGKGTYKDDDGNHYQGDFVNYILHGYGTLTMGNGSKYEGFFVNDGLYTGKLTSYNGNITYYQNGEIVDKITEKKSGYSPKIGQQVREYFDANWNRCKPQDASYYRLVTYSAPNRPKGVVKDYYISGELQGEYFPVYIDYNDEGKNFIEGKQTTYFKNGQPASIIYFYNNLPNGPFKEYYSNGALKTDAMWNKGEPAEQHITYYTNGLYSSIAKFDNGKLHNNKYLVFLENQTPLLIFKENFESNRDIWEFSGQQGTVSVVDDENITMQANPERQISGGIYTGFAPMSENYISIQTYQNEPGKGVVSLIFGFKNWDNYCAFSIFGNKYKFTYKKNGITVQDEEWKESSVISSDLNLLSVLNSEDKITMYVNNTPLIETGRIYYDGTLCGISLYNSTSKPIEIEASQLTVHEVVDPMKIPVEYLPNEKDSTDEWSGNGSGFFLNTEGYIATNYHVVEGTTALQANFTRNGITFSYPASVVVTDPKNDLAIIKIDDNSFKGNAKLPYGLMTRTKDTGSEVFALGYPMADIMGSEVKFTDGKISSKSGIGGDVRVYQISVPIQPGNSGGPLFDMGGNVVGITSSGLNRDYFKSENVNYAIKASYLKNLMEACPEKIILDEKVETPLSSTSLTDKIKQYEEFVVLILTK